MSIRTISIKNLAKAVATGSYVAAVTAPVDSYIGIKSLYVYNQHTTDVTVEVAVHTSAPSGDNLVLKFTLATEQSHNLNLAAIVLNPGEALYIKASVAGKVNYRVVGHTYSNTES